MKGRKLFCSIFDPRSRATRGLAVVVTTLGLGFLFIGTAHGAGELSQGSGPGVCFLEPNPQRSLILPVVGPLELKRGFCRKATAAGGSQGVVTSPDGRNVYITSRLAGAVLIFRRDPATGRLSQPQGKAGCISANGTAVAYRIRQTGTGRKYRYPKGKQVCRRGRRLKGVGDLVISADGRFVYGTSYLSDAVVAFARNPQTGQLTQLPGKAGCISEGGEGGCTVGRRLEDPYGLTISPDGRNVYAATYSSHAVVVLQRDPDTGALTQLPGKAGCVSDLVRKGECGPGNALKEATGVAVSPDGKNVYVASYFSDALAIFDRDPQTGALTQKPGAGGCIAEAGMHGCTPGGPLKGAESVLVSPDGKDVYVTAAEASGIAIFDRDAATGSLTQKPGTAGCIAFQQKGKTCQAGRAMREPTGIVFSPDASTVYVAAGVSFAVDVFDRSPLTGELTQKPGPAGCVSELRTKGACHTGQGLLGASRIAISPEGANLYVAAAFDGVTVFDRAQ